MLRKELIGLLSIIFFFQSCQHCTSTHGTLSSEELSWIPYSGGEKLLFKSQTGTIDTLFIGTKIIDPEAGYTEDHPCTHSTQSAWVDIYDYLEIVGTIRILVSHTDEWNRGSAGITTDSYYGIYFTFSNYAPQNNISINGTIYNNVYVMSLDSNTFTSPSFQPEVWKLFYSKANGILRYELTKGRGVWEKN